MKGGGIALTLLLAGVVAPLYAEKEDVELSRHEVACFDSEGLDELFKLRGEGDEKATPFFLDKGWCVVLKPGFYPVIQKTEKHLWIRHGAFRLYMLHPDRGGMPVPGKVAREEISARNSKPVDEVDLAGYNVACFNDYEIAQVVQAAAAKENEKINESLNRGTCAVLPPGVYDVIKKDSVLLRIRYGAFRLWLVDPKDMTITVTDEQGRREVSGK